MADTTESTQTETGLAGTAGRKAGRLARHIRSFAKRHGGTAEGHIAYLGARGCRIVLVAEDGDWGDLVAPTHAIAQRAVELAGVPVRESFEGEVAARVRTGPYEWSRMAGIQLGGPAQHRSRPER